MIDIFFRNFIMQIRKILDTLLATVLLHGSLYAMQESSNQIQSQPTHTENTMSINNTCINNQTQINNNIIMPVQLIQTHNGVNVFYNNDAIPEQVPGEKLDSRLLDLVRHINDDTVPKIQKIINRGKYKMGDITINYNIITNPNENIIRDGSYLYYIKQDMLTKEITMTNIQNEKSNLNRKRKRTNNDTNIKAISNNETKRNNKDIKLISNNKTKHNNKDIKLTSNNKTKSNNEDIKLISNNKTKHNNGDIKSTSNKKIKHNNKNIKSINSNEKGHDNKIKHNNEIKCDNEDFEIIINLKEEPKEHVIDLGKKRLPNHEKQLFNNKNNKKNQQKYKK